MADVLTGVIPKLVAGLIGQRKADIAAAVLIRARIGRSEISAGNHRDAMHDINAVCVRAGAHSAGAMNQFLVARKRAAHAGKGLLIVLVGAAYHGVNLKPRSVLDDSLHPVKVVDAGQLYKNLIVAQAILLNHRLADAQCIHAVADGLDSLLNGFLLQEPSQSSASWSA